MIFDRTVEIYSRSSAKDSEGIQVFTYTKTLTVRAQLQPIGVNPMELKEWGITTMQSNDRLMFVAGNPIIQDGALVKDLKTSDRYEVRSVNPWPSHSEVLLIPYQGQVPV